MERVSVVLLRDNSLLAEGIRSVLQQLHKNKNLRSEVLSVGSKAFERIQTNPPDVILVDVSHEPFPHLPTVRKLSRIAPHARIIVFSSHDEDLQPQRLSRIGVWGDLGRDNTPEAVLDAINAVAHGKRYYNGTICEVDHDFTTAAASTPPRDSDVFDSLTSREKEIFALLARGKRNRCIAERLNISTRTVENHRAHIMQKLGLHTVADLVCLARDLGIV